MPHPPLHLHRITRHRPIPYGIPRQPVFPIRKIPRRPPTEIRNHMHPPPNRLNDLPIVPVIHITDQIPKPITPNPHPHIRKKEHQRKRRDNCKQNPPHRPIIHSPLSVSSASLPLCVSAVVLLSTTPSSANLGELCHLTAPSGLVSKG